MSALYQYLFFFSSKLVPTPQPATSIVTMHGFSAEYDCIVTDLVYYLK